MSEKCFVDGDVRFAKRRWICKICWSAYRMKAPSLLPPGRRGVSRGRGRIDRPLVVLETTDEAGGDSRKPPLGGGDVAMIGVCLLFTVA